MNYLGIFLTVVESEVLDSISKSTVDAKESITGISKALHDYGPIIVITSVFIILFLGMALMILRNNAKLMNRVLEREKTTENLDQSVVTKFVEAALEKYTSSVGEAINARELDKSNSESEKIISEFNKELHEATKQLADDIHGIASNTKSNQNFVKNDYHKDIVGAYIDVSMTFKDASRRCLNEINASRIGIYVFHNGNTSICGLPFFKFSCIHEWTSNGLGTVRGKYHTDIPLQYFNDFIEDLWSNGYYKTTDIEKSIAINPSLEEFVAYSNVKALYIIGINDSNNKLVGFIIAEFDHDEDFDINASRDKDIRASLDEMSNKISPIIANKYIYKEKPKEF